MSTREPHEQGGLQTPVACTRHAWMRGCLWHAYGRMSVRLRPLCDGGASRGQRCMELLGLESNIYHDCGSRTHPRPCPLVLSSLVCFLSLLVCAPPPEGRGCLWLPRSGCVIDILPRAANIPSSRGGVVLRSW
ncbi:hypothetical protein K466DRAFT_206409 [Polyporus arcularius HHB13444]|uniref:Uncharacterized protein n=1 Tax=Polyporus arcularius HHB13444 TaxID=1314778 RepID=A0A5C3PV83_9APHY|nr:hypothetical protein K466DRAFT_206409 [Polyporus arcularius HHB13444]